MPRKNQQHRRKAAMKRYLVFVGDFYYPTGGWSDFVDSYDDEQEAIGVAERGAAENGWSQVIDIETGREVTK